MRVWLGVRWARTVTAEQLVELCSVLAAARVSPIVLEATGSAGRVTHRIGLPDTAASIIRRQLIRTVPGLQLARIARDEPGYDRATSVLLSTQRRPLRIEDTETVSRMLLTALSATGPDERLVLQWVLDGVLDPEAVPQGHAPGAESMLGSLVEAVRFGRRPLEADARAALKAKRAVHGWRVIGRVAVAAASTSRQRQLIGQVLAGLRAAEAPNVAVGLKDARTVPVTRGTTWRFPLRLNVAEVAALAAFPVGDTSILPVLSVRHRPLPPHKTLPTTGRVLGDSDATSKPRPVALGVRDGLRHLHVVGPTGTGKSTLVLSLVMQDIYAGRGVVLVEPKGDLVDDVLTRIPTDRRDDVILLDPTADGPVVGLNPLGTAGNRSPDAAADELLGVLRGLFRASWGARMGEILDASLRTLARTDLTLAALPLLLTDDRFRRRVVGRIDDPFGLSMFWAAFEGWSEAERQTAVAVVLNKVRPFLARPALRHIVGQAKPAWNMADAFARGRIVLVALRRGQLGSETANLLGSLVVAHLWQAVQQRGALPTEARRPVSVYLDEFAGFLHLPVDLADALVLSRSLGVGWTIAHQHLKQLGPELAATVLANARSRVVFQLEHDDAAVFARRSSQLDADDFTQLPNYHAYAQLVADGTVQDWCSLITRPAAAPTRDLAATRKRVLARYGVPASAVDAAMEAMLSPARTGDDDLAPRRRRAEG